MGKLFVTVHNEFNKKASLNHVGNYTPSVSDALRRKWEAGGGGRRLRRSKAMVRVWS